MGNISPVNRELFIRTFFSGVDIVASESHSTYEKMFSFLKSDENELSTHYYAHPHSSVKLFNDSMSKWFKLRAYHILHRYFAYAYNIIYIHRPVLFLKGFQQAIRCEIMLHLTPRVPCWEYNWIEIFACIHIINLPCSEHSWFRNISSACNCFR